MQVLTARIRLLGEKHPHTLAAKEVFALTCLCQRRLPVDITEAIVAHLIYVYSGDTWSSTSPRAPASGSIETIRGLKKVSQEATHYHRPPTPGMHIYADWLGRQILADCFSNNFSVYDLAYSCL